METLLASFLKDVGVSEEQFMVACKDGSSTQFAGLNRVSKEMIVIPWSERFPFFFFENLSHEVVIVMSQSGQRTLRRNLSL